MRAVPELFGVLDTPYVGLTNARVQPCNRRGSTFSGDLFPNMAQNARADCWTRPGGTLINLPPVKKPLHISFLPNYLSISEEISMKTRRTAEINSIEFGVLWRCALGIGHLFRIHACHDQTLLRWEIFQFGLHQWTTQWGSHTRMPLSVPGHSFLRWHWGQLVVGTSKSALQVLKIQSPGARTRNT